MSLKIIVLFIVNVVVASAYKSYRGYEIFAYKANSTNGARAVSLVEENYPADMVDIWKHSSPHAEGMMMISPSIRRNMTRYFSKNGVMLRKLSMNVERLLRDQRRENEYKRFASMFIRSRRQMHTYYMRNYEIMNWLYVKAKSCQYPLTCSTKIIGKTLYNRKLVLMKISTGPGKEKVWIDAGIHAREWITPSTALYVIDKLIEYHHDARTLLERFDFYILPLINPDGYEYTHTHARFWRKNLVPSPNTNCYGVDLNRNWGYHWGGSGASPSACMENFRGRAAFSEAETLSVRNYLQRIKKKVKLFITLHSFGQFILTPFSHRRTTYPSNIKRLRSIGHRVAQRLEAYSGRFYDVGSAADLLYEAAGGSDDYASAALRIPYTFTMELPDEGRYGFLVPPQYILQVGREMWIALKEFVDNI